MMCASVNRQQRRTQTRLRRVVSRCVQIYAQVDRTGRIDINRLRSDTVECAVVLSAFRFPAELFCSLCRRVGLAWRWQFRVDVTKTSSKKKSRGGLQVEPPEPLTRPPQHRPPSLNLPSSTAPLVY
eukprot:scaffold6342_cov206-Alexandrium_tamarense.AAC.19